MSECLTCSEVGDADQSADDCCVASKRPCGHHCNCVWVHSCCHWCGGETSEDGEHWVSNVKIPEASHA